MTYYPTPYFLEDKSGELTGSEFIDIHGRMHLSYHCTKRDTDRVTYKICNTTYSSSNQPLSVLVFGSNKSLGTISFGTDAPMEMKKYLVKTSVLGSSKVRKFVGSDHQEYRWAWRIKDDQEWTCTNSNEYLIAYYNLKTPGVPDYPGSSGCMLTVEEPYGHLVYEMLASLMIMRHIAAYNP